MRTTQRRWTRAVADALTAQGYSDHATRLRRCGAVASVYECPSCGDCDAHVRVRASCDVRVCPYCARVAARERSSLVLGALARVGETTAASVASARVRLDEALTDLETRGRAWEGRTGVRADSVRATLGREAAVLLRARVGLKAHARAGWSLKLITISPPWNPTDENAYSVAGLRARLDDVRARWSALWREGLGVLGAASAYVRVELSAHGHVHAHVLYYGPYWKQEWLTRIANCHVWIERVTDRAGAVREATKYALKAPVPGGAWLYTPQYAPHPELAARWQIATRGRRLCEAYGTMRAALHAEEMARGATLGDDAPPEAPTAPRCASCGECLDGIEPRYEPTAAVARRLGAKWSERGMVHPVRGPLPPRVQIHRV